MTMTPDRPNPGSTAAIRLGCRCPVMDNCHGEFAPWPATEDQPAAWIITKGCPVHDTYGFGPGEG